MATKEEIQFLKSNFDYKELLKIGFYDSSIQIENYDMQIERICQYFELSNIFEYDFIGSNKSDLFPENANTYIPENIVNSPFAIEGRDYVIFHITEQQEKKKGRKPGKVPAEKIQAYNLYRSKGHNQKRSAELAGITEKTAGTYEIKRLAKIQNQISELDKIISRLEQKADNPATPAKDLLLLTAEIERLNEKKKNCI